jgi:hypothetical protein
VHGGDRPEGRVPGRRQRSSSPGRQQVPREEGSVIIAQHWYRDGNVHNLSDALQIMFGI